ncbi:MAG TPA: hypothetical protein VMT32_17580 [Bryobacteraceae bacterium]|nr:hypothetical protein [Bryobacteraceae bacterium]
MSWSRLSFSAALLATALAYAESPQGGLATAVFSDYVWRGALAARGPVSQSSVDVDWSGVVFRVWQNMDLSSDRNLFGRISEVDYDLSYTKAVHQFDVSAGTVRYTFPNAGTRASTELYTGATTHGWLNPSVRAYFRVGSAHGGYLTVDVLHRFAFPSASARTFEGLDLSAGAGWGSSSFHRAYFGVARTGLSDLHPAAALPVHITRSLRLVPTLAWSMMLDPRLRQSSSAFHGFIVGATLSARICPNRTLLCSR